MTTEIKRYWAFCAPNYYPVGGMLDDHASFSSINEAQAWAQERMQNGPPNDPGEYHPGYDWAHVWDMMADEMVGRFYRQYDHVKGESVLTWVTPEEEADR